MSPKRSPNVDGKNTSTALPALHDLLLSLPFPNESVAPPQYRFTKLI